MGYRSEVAVAIKDSHFDTLINGKDFNAKETLKPLLDNAEITRKDDGVLIYWDTVKWYGKDVDCFMDCLSEIDQENWCFIELGDADEDIVQQGFWHNNPFELYVTRSINICRN